MGDRSNFQQNDNHHLSAGGQSASEKRGRTRGKPGFKGGKTAAGSRHLQGMKQPDQLRRQQQATPARMAALTALTDVLDNGAYVSEAINRQLSQSTFPQNDRRFCTALVYGTLENLTAIDYILNAFIEEPGQLDDRARMILRLAVCQKAFMDKIPDSAIADEAVRMTRQINLEYLTGFVNGVLRSYFRQPEKAAFPDAAAEPVRYLSVRYSMPEWIINQLIDDYGRETAEKVISYRPSVHDMTIRPNLSRYTDDSQFEALLSKKVWKCTKGHVPHAYHLSGVMQIARDTDYLSGAFSIQGEASMLCAQMAQAKPGMNVLDACAAPGGKTAYMAESMQGTGRVYAWDLHEHRVALLNAMKNRLRLDNIRTAAHDAQILKEDFIRRMDVCLIDAPCSGLGVINDKPDIKYGASQESLAELTAVQQNILNVCSEYVRQGGALIYSTCSMLAAENEKQCALFLECHPDFQLDPLPAWVSALYPDARKDMGLQLLPGIDGNEGFYIARFRRIG